MSLSVAEALAKAMGETTSKLLGEMNMNTLDTEALARTMGSNIFELSTEKDDIEERIKRLKFETGISDLEFEAIKLEKKITLYREALSNIQKLCDHKWYNDQPQTIWSPCLKCGISFGDWANGRE